RNLPLLFQILFWYLAVLGALPGPRQSLGLGWQPLVTALADGLHWLAPWGPPDTVAQWLRNLASSIGAPEVYLNNRGLIVPRPIFGDGAEYVALAVAGAIVGALALRAWARRRQDATGAQFPVGWTALGLIVGPPVAVLLVLGVPVSFEQPVLRG